MRFFLTLDQEGNLGISPLPSMDKLLQGGYYFNPGLPLSLMQSVKELLTGRVTVERILKKLNTLFPHLSASAVPVTHTPVNLGEIVNKQDGSGEWEGISAAFMAAVSGRQLTEGDLALLANKLGLRPGEIIKLAHFQVEKGLAHWIPAVMQTGKGWRCQRCGQTLMEEWPSLYGPAATCISCKSLGPCTSLHVLLRDLQHKMPTKQGLRVTIDFQPKWALTTAQQRASEEVLEFVQGPQQEAVLWAACGAGKTEVCFPAVAWALRQGQSVLFAAPRQDVVLDVAPRLKRDFSGLKIQVLSGSMKEKFQEGDMVLATTHQVLRFYHAFDLIFLDEVDAFPYQGSEMLKWGLKSALKPGGKILYLTATPSEEHLAKSRKNSCRVIRLPARHHRHSVPVPVWEKHPFLSHVAECTEKLTIRISALRRRGPVLVFVPKISWVKEWVEAFRRSFPHLQIDGSYSSDPLRRVKLYNLCSGRYDLFVSTSILERGVTIPRVQVIVLAADHPVFDVRALVQMAGRAGRVTECPSGEVYFLSEHQTPAIRQAIAWIKDQNHLAARLGLIDA